MFHPRDNRLYTHSLLNRFDWNKFLGQNGQSFVDEHGAEAQSFVDKFTEYAEGHLSGSEAEDVEDNSKGKARPKLSNLKPDLTFTRNSKQEALLPHNCLDLKLEDKKHVFRCFLKSQYGTSTLGHQGINQKLSFPSTGKGCLVSWIPMYSTMGEASRGPRPIFCPGGCSRG
jgi:hypothetical protein